MTRGWYGQRHRHSLASKGVKTVNTNNHYELVDTPDGLPIVSEHFEIEQAVYVPSTSEINVKISEEEMNKRVAEVRQVLSNLFGGYTSVEAIGGYYDKDNSLLVVESVVKVTSYATMEKYKENSDKLIKYLERKRKKWSQDTMGYELEGDLYYLGEVKW